MAHADVPLPQVRPFGATSRRDRWWAQPLMVFLGLAAFVVYATWAALQGEHYSYDGNGANYLSPFYSPLLWGHGSHAWFGQGPPSWWPSWLLFSPALLILWAPGGFRLTCYYYRGAYYKAFWGDPPACAVGEPGFRGRRYRGEAKFPLILQNVHRYFLYLALLFLVILSYDAVESYRFGEPGSRRFGIGVGTIVLTLNPILLGGYTLGCHSLRHLVGGRIDEVSRHPAQKRAWDCVSCLNRRHMAWAWVSLFWVALADLYVRLCSMGVITDLRIV